MEQKTKQKPRREKIGINLVRKLKYNGKNERVWDTDLRGFGISIQKDSMSYIILYRNSGGKVRYFTLGRVGPLTPDEARKLAKEKLASVIMNDDPADRRKENKNIVTLFELCEWYMKDGTGNKRPHTIKCDQGAIDNHIKPLIGNIPIKTITRGAMETFLKDVTTGEKTKRRLKSKNPRGVIKVRGGTYAGAKALDLLGAMFEFAIKHEKMDKNPAHGVRRPTSKKRDVFLDVDEIQTLGALFINKNLCNEHKTGIDALKLLLLTGCRKSEILTLKWDYVDYKEQCLRLPRTKSGVNQIRPVGIGAINLLRTLEQSRTSDFVFPATKESAEGHLVGLYKMFQTILDTKDDDGNLIFAKKQGLNIHSLRHTYASMGEYLGYGALTIAGLLGDISTLLISL